MALHLSQAIQSARVCMPLAKLSYANVSAGNVGPIPWTHIASHNDLFAVLDPIEVVTQTAVAERRYRLRVVQDPDVREEFDLQTLASEAQKAIDELRRSNISGRQPYITIIVKNPCIAMRYPLPDGQVHRFQVRFVKEEDFYETLKVFAVAKVPFVEAGTATNIPVTTTFNNPAPANAYAPYNPFPKASSGDLAKHLNTRPSQAFFPDSIPCAALYTAHSNNPPAGHAQAISLMDHFSASQPALSAKGNTASHSPFVTSCATTAFGDTRFKSANPNYDPAMNCSQGGTTISTYVPRPSTAPVVTARSSGSDLPPQRDLPFQRKIMPATSAAPLPAIANHASTTERPVNVTQTQEKTISIAPKPSDVPPSVEGKKVKRRAVAKPAKAPVTKKAKAVTKRKGADIVNAQNEDIIHFPNKSQHGHERSQADVTLLPQIDTQALLEKADSIQASREAVYRVSNGQEMASLSSNTQTALNLASNTIQGQQGEPKQLQQPRNSHDHIFQPQDSFPETSGSIPGSNEIVNSLVQTGASKSSGHSRRHGELEGLHTAREPHERVTIQSEQRSSENAAAPRPHAHQSPAAPAPAPSVPKSSLLNLLLSDLNFTQPVVPTSDLNLDTDFHNLSESQQHSALESWIVQNLNDDGFLNLCKVLGGVWQRIFVKF